MKPIVIRQDEAWLTLFLSIFPFGMFAYGINAGIRDWTVWFFLVFGVVALVGSIFAVNHSDMFTEEGITRDGLLGRKTIPWSDVIQVKLFYEGRVRRGWTVSYYPRLGFTFKGGRPMGFGQNPSIWMLINLNTSVDTPYREDLKDLVLRCYGPLDD